MADPSGMFFNESGFGCAPSTGVSRFGGPSTNGRCRLLRFWPAKRVDFIGAPGPIRTADPLVRSRPSTVNQQLTQGATFCHTSLFLSIHAVSPRWRVTLWHSIRTGRGYKSGHTVCGLEGLGGGDVAVGDVHVFRGDVAGFGIGWLGRFDGRRRLYFYLRGWFLSGWFRRGSGSGR